MELAKITGIEYSAGVPAEASEISITSENHDRVFHDLKLFYELRIREAIEKLGMAGGRGNTGGTRELSRKIGFSDSYIAKSISRKDFETLRGIVLKIEEVGL